jgi:hypothetical protein
MEHARVGGLRHVETTSGVLQATRVACAWIGQHEEIEQARRDLAPLRDMTPAELEIHCQACDMWPEGPDPLRRLLGLLRQAEAELEQ